MATRDKLKNLTEFTALKSTEQASLSKKVKERKQEIISKEKDKEWNDPGVVYLGHIPHGFYEEQMWQYFSQFGDIRNLKLSRSKRTGRSKGYAFIKFKSEAAAKVVAGTMNNYLMFNRLLKCQFLPMTKVHPETFLNSNRPFCESKSSKIAARRHNAPQTDEQKRRAVQKRGRRLKKSLKKMGDMGIEYDLSTLVKKMPGKSTSKDTSKAREETAEVLSGAKLAEMEKEAHQLLNEETISDDEGVGVETSSETASDTEISFKDVDINAQIATQKRATGKSPKVSKRKPKTPKATTPKKQGRTSARKKTKTPK